MRCFPLFSILQNIYSRKSQNPSDGRRPHETGDIGLTRSTGIHDALYSHVDNIRPFSRTARTNVARVTKTLNAQLRPVGKPVEIPGNGAAVSEGFRTGFQNIFAHRTGKKFSVALSDQQTVIRTKAEVETHLLIQNYLRSRYDDPAVPQVEILRRNANGGQQWKAIADLISFRRRRDTGHEETEPRIASPSNSPERNLDARRVVERGTSRTHIPANPVSGATRPVPRSPQQREKAPVSAEQRLLNFFKGNYKDRNNPSVREVLGFNHQELENNHDFIQWLFPTDQSSRFNPTAPVASGNTILTLRKDRAVSERIDEGLEKMLEFYGLADKAGRIAVRAGKEKHVDGWLDHRSHHCLRMTRMLRSLSLFGKNAQAAKLFTFLSDRVRQLPEGQRARLQKSLEHWRNALSKPVQLTDSNLSSTAFLFPNKRLRTGLGDNDPGHGDSPIKAALFRKQEAIFAKSGSAHTTAPLIAHFSKPDFVERYQRNQHLEALVEDHARGCAIEACAGYYFPKISDARGTENASAKPQDSIFKVYVDFANRSLGGAWRQSHGYAQEEIAFLENAGLGAVAQHAANLAGTAQDPEIPVSSSPNFGHAFSTRTNDKPTPILVEGCVRVAHFGSYGHAASKLPLERAVTTLERAEPETTNWLAIAAPDLRPRPGQNVTRSMQFEDIFNTAHAGFSMTKALAGGKAVDIHTGQFGCGVFRNDVTLSTAAQMLAAKLAGIDHIQFHGYLADDENAAKFNAVKATIDACVEKSLTTVPRENIRSLVERAFEAIEASLPRNALPRGA